MTSWLPEGTLVRLLLLESARERGYVVQPPTHRRTAHLVAALAERCLAHLPIADHICCAALLVAGRPLLRLEILIERAH